MPKLPEIDSTIKRIYDHYQQQGDSQTPRPYLGASILGHECERALWYIFRWAYSNKVTCYKVDDHSGRIYRLFKTGHREEARIIEDLRNIGLTVHDVDPNHGRQFRVEQFGGHFAGHMDGVILGLVESPKTWHVFEAKTYSVKRFKELTEKGVKESAPTYYAQCQIYMGLTGLTRTFFLAVEKDTEQFYMERLKFDKQAFEALLEKARRVIFADHAPEKISKDPSFYKCKMCDARPICHGSRDFPKMNCRTCMHVTPEQNGSWTCSLLDKTLSYDDQLKGCINHLTNPTMVNSAVAQADNNAIYYQSGVVNYRGGAWSAPFKGTE